MLELSRDAKAPIRERFAATLHLLDRQVGKPLAPSELTIAIEGLPTLEQIAAMSHAERMRWLIQRERLALPPAPDEETDEHDDDEA